MVSLRSSPIEVAHSWIDYLTAWSTVAAALLALSAILYAVAEARRSDRGLRRERGLYYELALLQKLSEIIPAEDRSDVLRRQVIGILSALPGTDLPLMRAFVHVREPAGASDRLSGITSEFASNHPDLVGSDELQSRWNALAYAETGHEPEWAREVNQAIRERLDDL
ncbi:MAG: hypothetical protein ABSB01_20155 [Streptosporangiaceae bacterium]